MLGMALPLPLARARAGGGDSQSIGVKLRIKKRVNLARFPCQKQPGCALEASFYPPCCFPLIIECPHLSLQALKPSEVLSPPL